MTKVVYSTSQLLEELKNQSMDVRVESVKVHWPESVSVCSDAIHGKLERIVRINEQVNLLLSNGKEILWEREVIFQGEIGQNDEDLAARAWLSTHDQENEVSHRLKELSNRILKTPSDVKTEKKIIELGNLETQKKTSILPEWVLNLFYKSPFLYRSVQETALKKIIPSKCLKDWGANDLLVASQEIGSINKKNSTLSSQESLHIDRILNHLIEISVSLLADYDSSIPYEFLYQPNFLLYYGNQILKVAQENGSIQNGISLNSPDLVEIFQRRLSNRILIRDGGRKNLFESSRSQQLSEELISSFKVLEKTGRIPDPDSDYMKWKHVLAGNLDAISQSAIENLEELRGYCLDTFFSTQDIWQSIFDGEDISTSQFEELTIGFYKIWKEKVKNTNSLIKNEIKNCNILISTELPGFSKMSSTDPLQEIIQKEVNDLLNARASFDFRQFFTMSLSPEKEKIWESFFVLLLENLWKRGPEIELNGAISNDDISMYTDQYAEARDWIDTLSQYSGKNQEFFDRLNKMVQINEPEIGEEVYRSANRKQIQWECKGIFSNEEAEALYLLSLSLSDSSEILNKSELESIRIFIDELCIDNSDLNKRVAAILNEEDGVNFLGISEEALHLCRALTFKSSYFKYVEGITSRLENIDRLLSENKPAEPEERIRHEDLHIINSLRGLFFYRRYSSDLAPVEKLADCGLKCFPELLQIRENLLTCTNVIDQLAFSLENESKQTFRNGDFFADSSINKLIKKKDHELPLTSLTESLTQRYGHTGIIVNRIDQDRLSSGEVCVTYTEDLLVLPFGLAGSDYFRLVPSELIKKKPHREILSKVFSNESWEKQLQSRYEEIIEWSQSGDNIQAQEAIRNVKLGLQKTWFLHKLQSCKDKLLFWRRKSWSRARREAVYHKIFDENKSNEVHMYCSSHSLQVSLSALHILNQEVAEKYLSLLQDEGKKEEAKKFEKEYVLGDKMLIQMPVKYSKYIDNVPPDSMLKRLKNSGALQKLPRLDVQERYIAPPPKRKDLLLDRVKKTLKNTFSKT